MTGRDIRVATRVSESQHNTIELAAKAQDLKVSEWVRHAVLRRLSEEDATLVQQCFAIRLLLLNVLLYLAPTQRGITATRLLGISQAVDHASQKHAERVLATVSSPAETLPGSLPAAALTFIVQTRLTESQYEAVTTAAAENRQTVADWFRDAILTELRHEAVLGILQRQVQGLRTILDDAVGAATSDPPTLGRTLLAELDMRTDPSTFVDPVNSTHTR
jgi:uncharacterized protein (DUF1778 family)